MSVQSSDQHHGMSKLDCSERQQRSAAAVRQLCLGLTALAIAGIGLWSISGCSSDSPDREAVSGEPLTQDSENRAGGQPTVESTTDATTPLTDDDQELAALKEATREAFRIAAEPDRLYINPEQDRSDLKFVIETYAELQRLREESASEDAWDEFSERVLRKTAPMIERLHKTTKSTIPARQCILWSCRDYLPRMLVHARDDPDTPGERKFVEHLNRARSILDKEDNGPVTQ